MGNNTVKLDRKIESIEIINNCPMLEVPKWEENDKIQKVASVVSKLKIIARGVEVLKYFSNVSNFSILNTVWIDVAAPNPKSSGKAIILAKFKLRPNKIKKDNENSKEVNKFIKIINY